MKTRNKAGLKIRATVKAGGIGGNHNRAALKVRTTIKAGGIGGNHNRTALKVRTGVISGYTCLQNHSFVLRAIS